MATQRADNLTLKRYRPATFGETPSSPAMTVLRILKESFKDNKLTVKSQVLGNRQVKKIYKVGEHFVGGLNGELAFLEWNWAFENVLGGAFTAVTVTASDISFAAADSSINSVGAGFGSFVANSWLLISGTASHNGLFRIATKTSSSKMILADGVSSAGVTITVANESAGASMTVKANNLRQGSTMHVETFERDNTDAATFDVWNSFAIDELKLSLKGEALVSIEVTGQGKISDLNNVATVSGSIVAQSSNDAYNSTNNWLRAKEGSTVLSDELVSLDLTIKSNLRARRALGNSSPTGLAQGDVEVAASAEFYHTANTRRQQMKDHDENTFFVILKDASSRYFIITIRRFYYMDLSHNAEAKNSDVLEKYSLEAAEDATYAQTITIDSLS